jgi:tRNA pseudouridine38-40 synthase
VPRFRLVLEYDGTDFEGWQVQRLSEARAGRRAPRTVQGVLEEALTSVTGQPVVVHGAGRTDAGVHAEGQVASVSVETHLGPGELRRALDAVLPRDVAVLEIEPAREGFHARRDARAKRYVYRIWNGPVRSPLRDRRSAYVRGALDVEGMREAARHLLGRHDFASFRASGSSGRTSVRTIRRLELRGEAGGEITIEVEGDGFLRHMIRNLVGTLLEIGRGRRAPASIPQLLDARDRKRAGPTAPARGLTLASVAYDGGDVPTNSKPRGHSSRASGRCGHSGACAGPSEG